MSADEQPKPPDPVHSAIQSRHPGIDREIDGAINVLRKLKQITGSSVVDAQAPPPGDPGATVAHTLAATGAANLETGYLDPTEAGPGARRDVPLLAASQSFGRYQIVRLLGKGAMGAVYLAYDTQLHRHVALKTPFLGEGTQVIDRFYREARAAAQLRSPYVCPIYDVGEIGHIHYLSMAYIDGRPLTRLMTEGQLRDTKAIADVVRKIALGLQAAHEENIIHRDLKPDNIMVDRKGDPIVMDFGLARRVDDEVLYTRPGSLLGTPAYMSPEQVEGDPAAIGHATDIYSLGVVLFQMLTGRLPFQGSLTSVLRQIGEADPPRLSTLNPSLGEDSPLERICLKMMAKAPPDRFASMAEVVAALEGITARPVEPVAPPSGLAGVWLKTTRMFSFLGSKSDRTDRTQSSSS
jgi:serine/threonine protein kinase